MIGSKKIQNWLGQQKMNQTDLDKNTTTPKEMAGLFAAIYQDVVFAKPETKDLFYAIFTDTMYEDRIPVGVPDDVQVVHKIGNQVQVWNDCGVVLAVHPYAICILTDQTKETEAQEVLPKISEIIYGYEAQK